MLAEIFIPGLRWFSKRQRLVFKFSNTASLTAPEKQTAKPPKSFTCFLFPRKLYANVYLHISKKQGGAFSLAYFTYQI